MSFEPISMRDWVNKNPPMNSTMYKSIWVVWLWIGTAFTTLVGNMVLIAVATWCAKNRYDFKPPALIENLYNAWLFGLAAFSGITTGEFYGKRKTHMPYMEQQEETKEREAASRVNVEHADTVNTGAKPQPIPVPVAVPVPAPFIHRPEPGN